MHSIRNGHYVTHYLKAEQFSLSVIERTEDFSLQLSFQGEEFSCSPFVADTSAFHTLAVKYHDSAFPGIVRAPYNTALSTPLTSVSITCDKALYDRPAAEELGDRVLLCGSSPYAFIQSGYEKTPTNEELPFWWFMWGQMFTGCGTQKGDRGYHAVEIPAHEVNEENTPLLWHYVYLYFKEKPAIPGEYTFTVTLRWDNKTVSRQVTHKF